MRSPGRRNIPWVPRLPLALRKMPESRFLFSARLLKTEFLDHESVIFLTPGVSQGQDPTPPSPHTERSEKENKALPVLEHGSWCGLVWPVFS